MKYSIKNIFRASFTLIFFLFLLVAIITVWSVGQAKELENILADIDKAKHHGHLTLADIQEQYIHQAHTIIVKDHSHVEHYGLAQKMAIERLEHLKEHCLKIGVNQNLYEIEKLVHEMHEYFINTVVPGLEKDKKNYISYHNYLDNLTTKIRVQIIRLNSTLENKSNVTRHEHNRLLSRTQQTTTIILSLSLISIIILGFAFTSMVGQPFAQFRKAIENIKLGQPETTIQPKGLHEFRELAIGFNQLVNNLSEIKDDIMLSERMVAVEKISAGVAHELSNPFNIITNHTTLLKKNNIDQKSGPFIGNSNIMQQIYKIIDKAASNDINVLVTGESGTGKELVARSIHDRSLRKKEAFITINCGALPIELAESELFGHVKGAFTGANTDKAGLFETAKGGTLFLDEINSLPLNLQVKLNRAIEQSEGRRIGANQSYKIDVRFIAATNVDLQEEVKKGNFREDLYFRLHVLNILLPPLKNHKEDIPLLAAYFLKIFDTKNKTKGFTPESLKALLAHNWPGNIRELRNAIESAVAITDDDQLQLKDFPKQIIDCSTQEISAEYLTKLTYQEALDLSRNQMLSQYLRVLMDKFEGNVSAAAKHASIERETLHRLLKKHNIAASDYKK